MPKPTVTDKRPGFAVWLATSGGIGYLPIPGTFGSLVGVGIVYALGRVPFRQPWHSAVLLAAAILVYLVGVRAAGLAEDFFGSTDPGHVVIDEVAGQMFAFLLCPDSSWKWLLVGFLLFRLFDVVKPFPAGRAEHLKAGWGVMTDDLIAGVYTSAALVALGFWFK